MLLYHFLFCSDEFLCIWLSQGRPEVPGVCCDTPAAGIWRRHFNRRRKCSAGHYALQLQVPKCKTVFSELSLKLGKRTACLRIRSVEHCTKEHFCLVYSQLLSCLLIDKVQMELTVISSGLKIHGKYKRIKIFALYVCFLSYVYQLKFVFKSLSSSWTFHVLW